MRLLSRVLVPAVIAGAAVLAYSAGATPASPSVTKTALTAEGSPSYAVEDFNYPQADKILAEQGITLKRGDGHIVLAECGSETGLLVIDRFPETENTCFRVTGNGGFLTLEIPAVRGVRGNDYTTTVNMTVDDEEKSFSITKNSWTPVGASADEQQREHLLVEIVATK